MRTILGVAIGTIAFWLAMLATLAAYILEHIFAIGLTAVLVVTVFLARRLVDGHRRRRTHTVSTWPPLGVSSPAPRRFARPASTAHMRKVA